MADQPDQAVPQAAELLTKLQRERRKLELTLEIGRALSSTAGRERLYEGIIENVTQIMDADRASLYLVEDGGKTLVTTVATGDGAPSKIRLQVGEGIAGSVAEVGKTVIIPDAYSDPRFQPAVDSDSGYRTRSVLCTALTDGVGAVIGVLQVLNKKHGTFDADDQELLEALAGQVAIAVENSSLYHEALEYNIALMSATERLRQQRSKISVLLQLEREVSSALSSSDIYERLLGSAMELARAKAGSIAVIEGDGKSLRFETTAGPTAEKARGLRIAVGQGLIGWVVAQKEAAIVNDPANDSRHERSYASELGHSPSCLMAVPLITDGEVIGAIELLDCPGGFSESDRQLAELIASQIARAVVTARRRSMREVEERLSTIGQMMAGVLHDLRTPLTVISGYGELMAESDDHQLRARHAKQVQHQLGLMNGMIREILAFARGDTALLLTQFPLNLFFEDVKTQIGAGLEQAGVALIVKHDGPREIRADRVKLLRLCANLANNAATAMVDGGTFTIQCNQRGGDAVLEFIDDGPGIPAELEGRLFDLFARGGAGGTGLGLAIVKSIVEQHGGEIIVESERGQGTRFEVVFSTDGPENAPRS